MLYPKSKTEKLDSELFMHPTSEYRGAPFWAWNCKLDKQMLEEQIGYFRDMGFGGFHMHSRTGMATNYLSEEFFELIKYCVGKAKRENMLAWLYDEDRYSSGVAGGYVTKHNEYRERYLSFTLNRRDDAVSSEEAVHTGKPCFAGRYDIVLDSRGMLKSYRRISMEDTPKGIDRFAYICTSQKRQWHNGQSYVDTLNREAIDCFIRYTYEAYKKAVGEEFGKTVPAIFTDEPFFRIKKLPAFAFATDDFELPWTYDLSETFQEAYGYDIVEKLPELFWEWNDGKISVARYHFFDHLADRFSEAYTDNCGEWCEKNNIIFTGHLAFEDSMEEQAKYGSEVMRSYRSFQLPGIDVLCNNVLFLTAKQAQSIVHQYGREGMTAELYGVTNWDFDFRGHKFQGDWLAALGVTVRVPHLSWASMKGLAKRDYPASIGYQSPWYKEYGYVEDHFARLNTALTRGRPDVKVAVIHPIESYWLHYGLSDKTNTVRTELENKLKSLVEWLLNGLIDFDFVDESLLPSLVDVSDAAFKIGQMRYDVILIPECETLRSSTVKILEQFSLKGGMVIVAGDAPRYMDAVKSDIPANVCSSFRHVRFCKEDILSGLEDYRTIDIQDASGDRIEKFVYNLRSDGDGKWLFIAHSTETACKDTPHCDHAQLKIKGSFRPFLYHTLDGSITPYPYRIEEENTYLKIALYMQDSILLRLEPAKEAFYESNPVAETVISCSNFPAQVDFAREEDNVLLLDMAKYRLDGGSWQQTDEVLKIDNKCRKILGWPERSELIAQPWAVPEEKAEHFVELEYRIESDIDYSNAKLGLEIAEGVEITFNGEKVLQKEIGYFVDKSIKTIGLPKIKKGTNTLRIQYPITRREGIESCYLLGDFDVSVNGRHARIERKRDKIGFDSIINQGMPFYGGNITYRFDFNAETEQADIVINRYRGSVLKILVNGVKAGYIAYEPYSLRLKNLNIGKNTLEIQFFGNRYNTFGALHNANPNDNWYGSEYWNSKGKDWSNDYILKETGILSAPVIRFLYSSPDGG